MTGGKEGETMIVGVSDWIGSSCCFTQCFLCCFLGFPAELIGVVARLCRA